ncbi:hypothetical protein Ssi03_21510 [Sphaerisporangium siamense]|uniref:Uncharacterized protein n=1 Tax=Sphaerisporangium siamense TaxID=795645 RepID=A0A7W7D7Y3_9ACTN|nr:hypothetical protein [Sphaerisporangium siamense]MBB4701927.1 hypothetical protein [Sphaerisporangium siamense]GII84161.1 hypothetical protein Ssi03_21510 [Sphaerisporangium siamense]
MARRRTARISTITLNTGSGAQAINHPYPARTPVLALDFGALSVLVTTSTGDEVTASDLEFARQLAHQAHQFATSVERCYHGLPNGRGVAA